MRRAATGAAGEILFACYLFGGFEPGIGTIYWNRRPSPTQIVGRFGVVSEAAFFWR